MSDVIQFKMDGPIFKENMPLHTVITGLSEFQNIIDKTYIVLSGKTKVSSADRQIYQIVASEFRKGSFISDLQILIAGSSQILMPFMSDLSPKIIWQFTKDAFSLLKIVFESKKKGIPTEIIAGDNNTINVHSGDIHTTFNGPVFNIAKLVVPHYQKMSDMLNEGEVESISAGEKDTPEKPAILLKTADKGLFKTKPDLREEPLIIDCEIFDFNKYSNIGKLHVYPEQPIPEGEYSFSMLGDQDNIPYIQSMLQTKVTIRCLKEELPVIIGGKPKIVRLHIVHLGA
jgi:hypothetical protein